MRIAFFSDIHGNKYVLEDFFRQTSENHVDVMIFCGDVFGYYYHQEHILNCFRNCNDLICIKGNHDQMFLDLLDGHLTTGILKPTYLFSYKKARQNVSARNVAYVRTWSTVWKYTIDGMRLAVFHGSPNNHLNGRIYPDTPLESTALFKPYTHIILGHTHHKMERFWADSVILNPGSIGQQRDGKGCSFLILDTKNGQYEFYTVRYDIDMLKKDIEEVEPDNFRLIEVLYRAK